MQHPVQSKQTDGDDTSGNDSLVLNCDSRHKQMVREHKKVRSSRDLHGGDCFADSEELETAVSQYLQDKSSKTEVAARYGWLIRSWCVSGVTDFIFLFAETDFNELIGQWNVASAKSMNSMFSDAKEFDQDLSGWNVSNVEDFSFMFEDAVVFNGNVVNWKTSRARTMENMFFGASSF